MKVDRAWPLAIVGGRNHLESLKLRDAFDDALKAECDQRIIRINDLTSDKHDIRSSARVSHSISTGSSLTI